jgi:hypothetical protein
VVIPEEEKNWVKALMLQHIYDSMISSDRVGRVDVSDCPPQEGAAA